jgi:hypothetical protein
MIRRRRWAGTVTVCALWFIFCEHMGLPDSTTVVAGREEFYSRLQQPIEDGSADAASSSHIQYTYIGWLCVLWGATVAAMAVMPNSPTGHACFLTVGGFFGLVAALLLYVGRVRYRRGLVDHVLPSA